MSINSKQPQTYNSDDPLDLSKKPSNTVKTPQYEGYQSNTNSTLTQTHNQNSSKTRNVELNSPIQRTYSTPMEAMHLRFIHQQLEDMKNPTSSHLHPSSSLNPRFPLLGYLPSKLPVPSASSSQPVQNKIYHCRNCQQFFLKLELFEDHSCNNLTEAVNDSRAKLSPTQPPANSSDLDSTIDESLLKHPLVKKTLQETYSGQANSDQSKIAPENVKCSSFFFICTTCGYRGNTARGVKQHGKLHLAQLEQFAVINISNRAKGPILVYNSNDDIEIQSQTFNSKNSNRQFDCEENSLIEKSEMEDSITPENIEKPKSAITSTKANDVVVPFSKKARILDLHFNQQKMLTQMSNVEMDTPTLVNKIKVEKSQTYCFKCNIQFQHISNFLAHKKLYCK